MTQIKERDYFFDNARALLIFLVVFGHLMEPYRSSSGFITSLYLTIYSFHMPGFLFISGYFAKKAGQAGYIEKLSKKLLIPYFIFFAFFCVYFAVFLLLLDQSCHRRVDCGQGTRHRE